MRDSDKTFQRLSTPDPSSFALTPAKKSQGTGVTGSFIRFWRLCHEIWSDEIGSARVDGESGATKVRGNRHARLRRFFPVERRQIPNSIAAQKQTGRRKK